MTANNIITTTLSVATFSVSVTMGILTYQISKAQKNLAKEKLKLDLFDRRYVLYNNIKKYLSYALVGKDIRVKENGEEKFYDEIFNCRRESLFLFGREMSEELYKIYRKINDGFSYKNGLKDIGEKDCYKFSPIQKTEEKLHEQISLIDEELKEYFDRVEDLFAPYMSFEDFKIK